MAGVFFELLKNVSPKWVRIAQKSLKDADTTPNEFINNQIFNQFIIIN